MHFCTFWSTRGTTDRSVLEAIIPVYTLWLSFTNYTLRWTLCAVVSGLQWLMWALDVGLQDSTTGTTKIRHILAATNTPPPSKSVLRRNANKVAILTARQQWMTYIREDGKLKQLTTEPLSEYRKGKKDWWQSYTRQCCNQIRCNWRRCIIASRGLQDAVPAGTETGRKSHTTHLSQTQFRHIMKASFYSRMFPGETAAVRTENRRMFAEDVKTRCQKIYTNVHMLHNSDATIIASGMPDII